MDDVLRGRLALKAFQHTAAYDAAIAAYLAGALEPDNPFPATLTTAYSRAATLRYGENPHQAAALYLPAGQPVPFEQLGGKEMSYNNWLDMDAAWGLAQEFAAPTVCIIKHTNPCGVASGASLAAAYPRALASDPVSAFGGIIAVNRSADLALAEAMADLFVEVVIAPDYSEEALAKYRRKANLRILRPNHPITQSPSGPVTRTIHGGLLVQTADSQIEPAASLAGRHAAPAKRRRAGRPGLRLARRQAHQVQRHRLCQGPGHRRRGRGADEPRRTRCYLAARRAGERSVGSVMASDAFFPFADGIEAAAADRRHGRGPARRLDARSTT